jgi:predicted Rossmann-fold nucleotide-binding protein
MRRTRGRVVEVSSVADLDRRLAAQPRSLAGWHLHGVDLQHRSAALAGVDVAGAVLVGCHLGDDLTRTLVGRGAVVLPATDRTPVRPDRSSLYTARELYDTSEYVASLDARIYGWSRQHHDRDASLARALHDHCVDVALAAWVRERRLVGVMGGHALARGTEEYAAAAHLGHALGSSYVVATGGGPGAMEAANLGASASSGPLAHLDAALATLARVPSYQPDVGAWVRSAFDAMAQVAEPRPSLGIPTWHYGHEPTNPFASAIAKYFRNATREAILLEVCDAGIVFLPGAAGTVQEIFQDACENYYADRSALAPMVLVGRDYWTHTVPAWPLLSALAADRPMNSRVHLAGDLTEAAEILGR